MTKSTQPEEVFTEEETAWHRAANYQWVPFVVRLLSHGRLQGKTPLLPIGNSRALTKESVDAVADMMNRAVWRFLAHDCGWFRVRNLTEARGVGSWVRVWDRSPELCFTDRSIDLLLAVYNGTRSEPAQEFQLPSCETNGDLLLQYLVYRRLTLQAEAGALRASPGWLCNPLTAGWSMRVPGGEEFSWDRLLEPDIIYFLPWLLTELKSGA